MVTIKDIAKRTNLSPSTVSRVLSGNPAISETTRNLVYKVAEEMHYSPNLHARNLVNRRNNTIGFMIPDIADNYFSVSAVGIEEVLQTNGYDVVYTNTNRDPKRVLAFLDRATEYRYAGVLITPDIWSDDLLKQIQKLDMPVIALRRKTPFLISEIPYVDSDHYSGFQEATAYLYSLGHRNIGLVTADTMIYNERQRGYEEVIRSHGLKTHIHRFDMPVPAALRYQAGYNAAKNLMQGSKLTAILCTDDRFAIGVLEFLNSIGCKVPEDISVIGCDDRPEGQLWPFLLSTVKQDIVELGRSAANMMLRILNDPKYQPVSMSLKPRLVLRNTTAPCANQVMQSEED
ncbi:MAG: LacI family DNA-binding transcriptional regulator [Clostridia bacterium]|nr:LacI family DNA-binding transcriptional regulator [Clostridia bacterium]